MSGASLLVMESPPGEDEEDSKHTIIKLANKKFLANLMKFHLVPDVDLTPTATQVDNKVAIEMNYLQDCGTQCNVRTNDVEMETSKKQTTTIATQTDQVHICDAAPRTVNHGNLKTVEISQNVHQLLCDKLKKSMQKEEKQRKIKSTKHNSRRQEIQDDENRPKHKEQSRKLPRAYETQNLDRKERTNRHGERISRRRHSPVRCKRISEDLRSTLSRNHRHPSRRKRAHSFDEDRRSESAHRRPSPKIHKIHSEEKYQKQQIKEELLCLRSKRSKEDVAVKPIEDGMKKSSLLNEVNNRINETICSSTTQDVVTEIKSNEENIFDQVQVSIKKDGNNSAGASFRDLESHEVIYKPVESNAINRMSSETSNPRKSNSPVPSQSLHTEDGQSRISNIELQSHTHIIQPNVIQQDNDGKKGNQTTDNIIKTVPKDQMVMDNAKEDGEISESEMEKYEAPVQKKMRPQRSPQKKLTQSFLNSCKTNAPSCLQRKRSTSPNIDYFHGEHSFEYYKWNDQEFNEIILHHPPLYPSATYGMERPPLHYDARMHTGTNYRYQSHQPLKHRIF